MVKARARCVESDEVVENVEHVGLSIAGVDLPCRVSESGRAGGEAVPEIQGQRRRHLREEPLAECVEAERALLR